MSISHSGTRHVSLFVPELLSGLQFLNDIPQSELPKLPAIQLLLSRASLTKDGFDNYLHGICELSGIQTQHQEQPIAALTVAVDLQLNSDTSSDYFLFAEPVVMKADRDSVVLLDSLRPTVSANSLTIDESKQLINEINHHFNDEPWQLNITSTGDWYLILQSHTLITTTNIATVLYNNAQAHLPKGDDTRYWRKIINEIEMLLFSSKVNEVRINNNKPAVTSLWLWGGGKVPEVIKSDTQIELWGDNGYVKTISSFLNFPHKSYASQPITELFLCSECSHVIIMDTSSELCWQRRDLYAWLDNLKQLETTLFKPLLQNLRNGLINTVSLYPDSENKLNVTDRSIKRWWKPVKSLTSLSNLL